MWRERERGREIERGVEREERRGGERKMNAIGRYKEEDPRMVYSATSAREVQERSGMNGTGRERETGRKYTSKEEIKRERERERSQKQELW